VFTPVSGFRENKPKMLVSVIENERFGLVFVKSAVFVTHGSINSGTDSLKDKSLRLIKKSLASLRKSHLAVIYSRGPA
jgi:hypothetical protein